MPENCDICIQKSGTKWLLSSHYLCFSYEVVISLELQNDCSGLQNLFIPQAELQMFSTQEWKSEVVKQEMARVNINILGISELKWSGRGEFNSDAHYIYYCGQESLRRNGVAIVVNKWIWNAVLGWNLINDTKISVHFQGKPFNITVIQFYVPTCNAEEAAAEQFYGGL